MCKEFPGGRIPKRTDSSQGIHSTGSIAVQSGGATEALDGTNVRPPVWPGRSPQITTGSSSDQHLGFLFRSSSTLSLFPLSPISSRRDRNQINHIYGKLEVGRNRFTNSITTTAAHKPTIRVRSTSVASFTLTTRHHDLRHLARPEAFNAMHAPLLPGSDCSANPEVVARPLASCT